MTKKINKRDKKLKREMNFFKNSYNLKFKIKKFKFKSPQKKKKFYLIKTILNDLNINHNNDLLDLILKYLPSHFLSELYTNNNFKLLLKKLKINNKKISEQSKLKINKLNNKKMLEKNLDNILNKIKIKQNVEGLNWWNKLWIRSKRPVKVIMGGRIRGISKAKVKKHNYGNVRTSTILKPTYFISNPICTKTGKLGLKLISSKSRKIISNYKLKKPHQT